MAWTANNEGPVRFTFEANLDVAGVKSLFEELRAISDTLPPQIVLDASKLERADTAVLQALVAVTRKLRDSSVPFEWQGCSANLVNSVNLLGLADALEMNGGKS